MGRVYDMEGNELEDAPHLGGLNGETSIGASVWEMLHPGQVQQEQRVTGNPDDVQSQLSIAARAAMRINPMLNPWEVAADAYGNIGRTTDAAIAEAQDAYDTVHDAAGNFVDTIGTAGKWVVIGIVGLALLEGMRKFK